MNTVPYPGTEVTDIPAPTWRVLADDEVLQEGDRYTYCLEPAHLEHPDTGIPVWPANQAKRLFHRSCIGRTAGECRRHYLTSFTPQDIKADEHYELIRKI